MFYERLLIRLRRERHTPAATGRYVVGISRRVRESLEENPEFVRSLLVVTLLLFGVVFLLSTWFSVFIDRAVGVKFLLWSSGWLVLAFLWPLVHTGLSRDSNGAAVGKVTAANALSLLRFSLIPGLFLLIMSGHIGYAVALFVVGAVSDVVDGYVARKFSQETRMGLVMDPLVDAAFNTSVVWALSFSGRLPLFLSLLLTVRYVFLLGGAAYIYVFRGPVRIRPTVFGKLSAVFLACMILVLMYLQDYGVPLMRDRLVGLLEIALAILMVGTILHVFVMGTYSLRLYPRVVSAEEEPAREETRPGS
ncbi:MAG: CDP-alcohol phosphatidyltransferase family protein [Candidatus Eiseniibacteriota bacterium]|nr:MAG: CDP-alcohol phosphatidyltransferase family protein [Candidatus Eisenbacteria bacterium]